MNVAYYNINASDAAKRIGVDYTTIVGWCRNNLINCYNVSEGVKNGRYLLDEKEVEYLRKLRVNYGVRKMLMNYSKDWDRSMEVTKPVIKANVIAPIESKRVKETIVEPVKANVKPEEKAKKPFDLDEIAITLGEIQDIKERLKNLEAEKTQLTKELEQFRKEVLAYI